MLEPITNKELFFNFQVRINDLEWSVFEKFESTVNYLYKVYDLFFTKENYKRYKEHIRIIKEIVNKNSYFYNRPLKTEFFERYVKSIWTCCNSSDYELLAHIVYEFSKGTDIFKIVGLANDFVVNKK